MRKTLLGTTAIVTAGLIGATATAAVAAEKVKVGIGGYMEQQVGYANNDERLGSDPQKFATTTEAKVKFKGKTTLDNGIEVGVQVHLEGNTHPCCDAIDESYIWLEGGFGKFFIGAENSAMDQMHYAADDWYGMGLNSGDVPNWVLWNDGVIFNYWLTPLGSTWVEPLGADDNEKITYYTPRVEGFQLGLSYGPDFDSAGGIMDRETDKHDMFSVGLNFNRNFDGAKVRLSGGYGTAKASGDDERENPDAWDSPSAYNLGSQIEIGHFGINASYANFDDSGPMNGESVGLGASYSIGPWIAGVTWFTGEREGLRNDAGVLESNLSNQTVHISAAYWGLGPGMRAYGTLGFSKFETDDTEVAPEDAEVNASYLVLGLWIDF